MTQPTPALERAARAMLADIERQQPSGWVSHSDDLRSVEIDVFNLDLQSLARAVLASLLPPDEGMSAAGRVVDAYALRSADSTFTAMIRHAMGEG